MAEPQRSKYELPNKVYRTPSWGEAAVDGISVIDEVLLEQVEPNKPGYVKLPEGSPHPNTREFPNHRLLKEEFQDAGTNIRTWCNGYRNEDQYNYDIAYSGESNSHPIFTRRYQERRDQYSVLTKESKFTGIYLIKVTNAGSNYTSEPTVTITGNATARAIISNDGTVAWIYLTSEGSGYTSSPTVTIAGGGGGGATATALLHLDTKVVYTIEVTAGGSGYSSEPTVTIAAPPSGVTASAVAQISSGGAVVEITVTAYGSGYVTAPAVTISGGGGTGATATSTLETATMRLVKEDVSQFPEDDPRRSLYVIVTRSYETLPGPVLIQHDYEPFIDTFTTSLKRIVLASTVPADMSYVVQEEGQITEYQPLSKYRSIQIVSKINPNIAWENGGQDQVYYGTANYSFPDEIQENPSISVYFAYSGDNLAIDFGWVVNLKEGYSGPCRAKFLRRYTFDPDDPLFVAALPQITYIQPESDVINNGFVFVGGNLIARATQFVVPKSLHPELDIDVTGTSPPVTNLPGPVASLPATVPESLPPGTEVVASIKPSLWRFRLWILDIVSVFVPTPT